MSEFLEIRGGVPLHGNVRVSGAKNAALPMLIASLLTAEECTFDNVPNLEDIAITGFLLEQLGGVMTRHGQRASISVPSLNATEASYSLVKAMRASFWVLAPLLARGGAARVALPGGDRIGARPVDIHMQALSQMGADIRLRNGVVHASAPGGLKPARIEFRFPSVGATHQVLMAAALTPGVTTISGAAREPEVVALADMLEQMGAEIEGAGTSYIVVRGREQLGRAQVNLIGDRIEAGTYLLAGAVTKGVVRVSGFDPEHLGSFLLCLHELGLDVSTGPDWVEVRAKDRLKALNTATGPFPSLATDLQAQLMAALAVADGVSVLEEHIFEGRFGHVSELCRMGAQITIDGRAASITGVSSLSGARVEGLDIRAAVALVVAGLAAEGATSIFETQHLRRGYDSLERKLIGLGARVATRHEDAEAFLCAGC